MQSNRRDSNTRNKLAKVAAIVAASTLFSGCAATYSYDGQKYNSKEDFHRAVSADMEGAISAIQPLPAPATNRTLIFALPTEAAILDLGLNNFATINGRSPRGIAYEMIENLTKSRYNSSRSLFDAAKRRNIYSSIQFVNLDSVNCSIEPSTNSDTLYYVEPKIGTGQWFYASAKHGKQIFAFDRSGTTTTIRTKAYLDALQALAIRD